MIQKLFRSPLFIAGSSLVFFFALMIIFAPRLSPHDPLKTDIWNILAKPGGDYPLGTDNLGRCILSRLIAGSRATLGTAFTVEALILTMGTLIGVIAGYRGGVIDAVILSIIDILLAFPGIILALVIAGLLGSGLTNLMIAMVSVYWVEHARVARSISRSVREKEFVLAARASGSGSFRIIGRHILPHVLPNMLVYGTLNMASIIIGISSMSFIGLGVKPPAPEWGALLAEGRGYMRENPLMLIAAVGCIMLSAACFQLLGEGLRDALSPRTSHLGPVGNAGMKKC
ncbi:glutathione ABC transporter permease GsiD [Spirochaetia bacterium]|nr:glutathione ABC transporter permease GsiD [Spirochaetia bacterium]